MRMTPLDVQSHRFARRISGFDREEVDGFLRLVAEDYESVLRENEAFGERVHRLETRVDELLADEKLLKETLVSAQSMTDELRQAAVREAQMLVSEAEVRAEKILDASHRRAARLAEEIREMRALRSRLASALRSAIATHLGLIESLEVDPEEDPIVQGMVDGKIAYLRRSPSAPSAASPRGRYRNKENRRERPSNRRR